MSTTPEVEQERQAPIPETPSAPTAEQQVAKESPLQHHRIETYKVGMPGAEKLVADTLAGEQVGVRHFEAGDVTKIKRSAVEENEGRAIQSLPGKPVDAKQEIAQHAIAESQAETDDLADIKRLLEGKRDTLLAVDSATVKNEAIPRDCLQLLIPKDELTKLAPHLKELGYEINEVGQLGVEATKGHSKFFFLYSKERGEPNLVQDSTN